MQGRLGWFCSCLIVQKIHKPDCPPRPQYPLSTLCRRPKVVRSTTEGEARFEVSGNVDGESDERKLDVVSRYSSRAKIWHCGLGCASQA